MYLRLGMERHRLLYAGMLEQLQQSRRLHIKRDLHLLCKLGREGLLDES
jgi:hypothetical protein